MIRHRYIDRICVFVCVAALLLTTLFMNGSFLGMETLAVSMPYESRLFDDTQVHTLDLVVDANDWSGLLDSPLEKEYVTCTVVIDGESFKNAAIRPKGNTSLSSVAQTDSDRYSFKIEFDHYDSSLSYYGLDKLALNNIYQDSTYLKDYLSYHLMNEMGIAAPLSSFVNITVNGEPFGFYLAVEGVEESLLQRTYGAVDGNLYKPDSMQMGGGGNAKGGFGDQNSASLQYIDDDPDSYSTIWDGAILDYGTSDQKRLVAALKTLASGEDLETAVDIDSVLKYFVAHNFVLNFDSYTGSMLHNYYLYEEDGIISMIPWDYNLAFGGFGGMGGQSQNSSATQLVNFPIDTPVSGADMESRPLLNQLLTNDEYLEVYHRYFDEFIASYFESGRFEEEFDRVVSMISSYVALDTDSFYSYDAFTTGTETLKAFCLLRAQSIRGQLDGTIPATTEGQAADTDSLIDASNLSISDMGSMGGGRGGMDFSLLNTEEGFAQRTAFLRTQSGSDASSAAVDSTQGTPPQGSAPPDGTSPNNGNTGNMPTEENASPDSNTGTQSEGGMNQAGPGNFEGGNMTRPDRQNMGNQFMPGDFSGTGQPSSQGTFDILTWILVGASILILGGGILFVVKHKRF